MATTGNGDQACAACGATGLTPHFSVRGGIGEEGLIPTPKNVGTALGDIVRCPACGHMQLDRFPSEEELDAEYVKAASDEYVEEEEGQRASAALLMEKVERYASPGRLVDVGCWVGLYMAAAEDRGWETVGIEPSTYASEHARRELGLDVRTDNLFTADIEAGSFDVVLLGDVLEHLTRAGDALEHLATWIKPGGVLVLLLPDAGSRVARGLGKRWWSVIPTHIHYFTRHSAAAMLRRHGYEPLYVGTDPKAFTWRYYLNKGGVYLPGLSRRLVAIAERLGFADRMFVPDFRRPDGHDRPACGRLMGTRTLITCAPSRTGRCS